MFRVVERIYPDHKIVGISELFVPGIGWYDTLIGGLADTLKKDIIPIVEKGRDAHRRTVEKLALTLEDKEGFQKTADFSIKELLE
ncbi:hypothetical protein KAW18_01095 [candidate division WOR-3 bacterium]|nr:hypothetical protein [candidate division WOR-3 bacterium]